MTSVLAAVNNFGVSFYEELAALVLVGIFIWRKVAPPLRRAMDARAEAIRAQLAAGDEARRATEELLAKRRAELEAAKAEAVSIVEQARRSAVALAAEGSQRAEHERERLVARATAEIDQQSARARDEVAARIAALVVAGAQRVVEGELDQGLHHRLIGEAIAAAETERA